MAKYKNQYDYKNANLNTSKISFLSGTQEQLNTYLINSGNTNAGKAVEGAFYLTTDTHRLYIGRTITVSGVDKTIPVPVNEGIETVAQISDLPSSANPGEFYYVSGSNILAVRSGNSESGASGWVQLNNDTNDDTKVTGFNISSGVSSNNGQTITYTWTLDQTTKDKNGSNTTNQPAQLTGSFTVDASAIAGLINVGVTASTITNSSNETTISTTGTGSNNSNTVTIKTTNGITLTDGTGTDSGKKIIKGLKYTLSNNATANSSNATTADIKLADDTGAAAGSVTIEAGTNLKIDDTASNKIKIKHNTSGVTAAEYGTTANTTTVIDNSTTKSAVISVPDITVDAQGHVTAASTKTHTVTVPLTSAVTADSNGKITITDSNNGTVTSGNSSVLYHKITVNGTENTVNNQNSLGSFYSASKIDELITKAKQTVNGMTYKGTVGDSTSTIGGSTLPTSNVSVGDTYAVNESGDITGNIEGGTGSPKKRACRVGDILIAQGTEDESTGYITSGLTWSYIPAGDIDTQYNLTISTSQDPSIQLNDTNSGTDSVKIAGGTGISVSGASDSTNGDVITVTHNNSSVTTGSYGAANNDAATLGSGGTFTVPGFTVDQQGHITAAKAKTYTLPASNNKTYTFSNDGTTLKLTDNNSSHTDVALTAGNNGIVLGTGSGGAGVTFSHKALTTAQATNPTAGDTAFIPVDGMTVVTGLTRDDYGHITGYTLGNYKEVTYSLTNSAANNTVTTTIADSRSSSVGTLAYTSDTLTLASTNTANTYSIDLKWGTF